ncbi:MAG: glycerol-3-phosphate dehydrogenase [Hyphomicrobiaceae bacterium]|nr:glycerol-3-phosphate dehydrogenase [Hyphomicrobiaceae bacterium]
MPSDLANTAVYDVAIIGGGINGCGIARDAAGRGLSVYLCEKSDLASGTSSASTKLIHGGLRYLEYYEFRLVRESLMEREVLWQIAPHIVRPLRFVLPHHRDLRPAWLLRLGLFIYDHLGGRKLLPATKTLDLTQHEAGRLLKAGLFTKGFEYSDCWVDDARLVVLNAMDAAARSAVVETRTALVSASRVGGLWIATVQDERTGATKDVRAKVLVNASGAWAGDVLGSRVKSGSVSHTRLVQGSHIIVPKLFDHAGCYIFQNADDRIIFAIPYETSYTLIGTTDQDFLGNADDAGITPAEIDYLCAAASEYFVEPVVPDDVVWTYSGVRSLFEDGAGAAQAATRDYVLDVDAPDGEAPLLSIFGGKITTYRRLAEHVMEKLAPYLPKAADRVGWTGREPLPGGDFAVSEFDQIVAELIKTYAFLPREHATRLVRLYGLRAYDVLKDARSLDDLGQQFGATLTAAEVDYLRTHEWSETAEDILWRRSKIGLKLTVEQRRAVGDYLVANARPSVAPVPAAS